jgi:hypothetical protein
MPPKKIESTKSARKNSKVKTKKQIPVFITNRADINKGLPANVYDGSCIPPEGEQPHYYKLAEEKTEGKKQQELLKAPLITAAGTDIRQLAASYWNLLLGPTKFIYWDPSARNRNCSIPNKYGKWTFIDKARDILEGESPPTQCNNVIGNNEYLSEGEFKSWYNYVFNSYPLNTYSTHINS